MTLRIDLTFLAACLASSLLVLPASAEEAATAEDADEEAARQDERDRRVFANAVELAQSGEHASAELLFEQLYQTKKHHSVAANLARAEEQQGSRIPAKYAEAANHYIHALVLLKDEDPDQRAHLTQRLAACRPHAAGLTLRANVDEATFTIDGEELEPVYTPHYVAPGRHLVSASAPGTDQPSQTVDVPAGGEEIVRFTLVPWKVVHGPKPTQPGSAETPATAGFPWWPALASFGLGAVTAAIGGGLWAAGDAAGADAAAVRHQLDVESEKGGPCGDPASPSIAALCDDLEALLSRHDDYKNTGIWMWIISGAATVAGGGLLTAHLLIDDDPVSTGSITVLPIVTALPSGGFFAGALGTW